MNTAIASLATDAHIEATIPYNSRLEKAKYGRAVFDQDVPANTTFIMEDRKVQIYDGRRSSRPLTLETTGFELRCQKSKVVDFYDRDEVKRVYFPEIEALLRETTGASQVFLFGYVIRAEDKAKVMSDATIPVGETRDHTRSTPALAAHIDHTLEAAGGLIRDAFGEIAAKDLLKRRYSIINVWRGVRPVERAPLAVCDGTTIVPEADLFETEVRNALGPKKVAFRMGYQMIFSPAHRWYYFPNMQPEELLLFRLVDSEPSRVQRVGHTSFSDPTSPVTAAPRESVEVRSICLFS